MKIALPPPRVLWSKMLKVCSGADLELFRFDLLIQLAADGAGKRGGAGDERAEFLGRIKHEIARRKQVLGGAPRGEAGTQVEQLVDGQSAYAELDGNA